VSSTGRGLAGTLWDTRELIWIFAQRDLRVRYKQAALGVVWGLFQPIASVAVFTLVFERLAKVQSQGVPYPLFALLGMVIWLYFSEATIRASEILVTDPNLVTKVRFPRVAAPASAMVSPLAEFAVSMVLVAVLMAVFGVVPGWAVLATPVWLVLMVLAAFGFALWLSALNVRFRDVRHALGPLMQILLFATPVAYPAPPADTWAGVAFGINPLTGVIGLARWSLFGAPWPGWSLVVSVGMIAVLLTGGLAYFRRAERSFADVI
jgi:ABC-2 type transport system permease protein/lipopolysaccharide transport system permease protein